MSNRLFKSPEQYGQTYERNHNAKIQRRPSHFQRFVRDFKWPKFLKFRRVLLLLIVLGIGLYFMIYFLGGYQPNPISTDMREFTETGFVDYEDYFKEKEKEVTAYNQKFEDDLSLIKTDDELVSSIDELIENVKTIANADSLKRRVTNCTKFDATQKTKYRQDIDERAKSNYDFARELMDEFVKAYENDNFIFYFNRLSTQFKIEAVERTSSGTVSKVLNTWYSNPQNDGVDPNARGGVSTINLQRSPVLVSYFTRTGSINQLTSYEYAISDQIVSGSDVELVVPSFKMKYIDEDQAIQVYYSFVKKGIKYTDFPKCISDDRWQELVDQNQARVDELIEELTKYYNEGDFKAIQEYVDAHKSNQIIKNYVAITESQYRDIVGALAYNSVMVDENLSERVDASTYLTVINHMEHEDHELMYKVACEMVRTEYLLDYKPAAAEKKISDTPYFKQVYNTAYDTEAAINNGFDLGCGYRECEAYSTMKKIMRNNLYQIFYTRLGYTEEDLEKDQEMFNYEADSVASTYAVAVEYKLTDTGLIATILANSIKESNSHDYPICKVDLLPYFTSETYEITKGEEHYGTNGVMVVPDGSGAVIELNNGKTDYAQYSKKIYSTDLAFGYQVKQTEQEDILLPMYAITSDTILDTENNTLQNGYAVIARVTKGAAQGIINANVSRYYDSYNKIYFSITLRESQAVKIGTGYYAKDITKFTDNFCQCDFVAEYDILTATADKPSYSYSDIAKEYQKMLLADGIISKDVVDTTDNTVVNVQLLGVYDYKDNFLGIVYRGHDTLTTFSQAVDVLKTLKDWGATNINLKYVGWRKAGLVNESFKNMDFASKLGSRSDYDNLLSYLDQENITLCPMVRAR